MNLAVKNNKLFHLTCAAARVSAMNRRLRYLSSPKDCDVLSQKEVKKHAETILKQHIHILNLISDNDYQDYIDTPELKTSSVGCHIRHSLDHFTWPIFSGMHLYNPFTNKDGSKIDLLRYDERARKTAVETNRMKARYKR